MNKNDFLLAVHEYLKAFGYRKNKSYWFLSNGELVYCVYVQSSQWDANDYYVEVGIAIEEIVGPKQGGMYESGVRMNRKMTGTYLFRF